MNRFRYTEAGKADLRRIDREQAMKIFIALTRYANTAKTCETVEGTADFRLRLETIAFA